MVKIRLKRIGRKNDPTYRIVVSDSRNTPRGMNSEEIGHYDPIDDKREGSLFINEESALKWLQAGAHPSESVLSLLKKTGIWAKYQALKPKQAKQEKVKKEVNKTSGKEKAKVKASKLAKQEARIARHKAKRLAKRADKQGNAPEASEQAEVTE